MEVGGWNLGGWGAGILRPYEEVAEGGGVGYSGGPEMTSALLILGIGIFLGMRHATDPDHVVAVSTIVGRERSIPRAGWIGALWGVGHTLTILVVGAAIILFGVVIPPR